MESPQHTPEQAAENSASKKPAFNFEYSRLLGAMLMQGPTEAYYVEHGVRVLHPPIDSRPSNDSPEVKEQRRREVAELRELLFTPRLKKH